MLAILNFLNAHNLPIYQPILLILVSKFMVYRALSDKTYLLIGLLSPLKHFMNTLSKFMVSKCSIPDHVICYTWFWCHALDKALYFNV